ncbi:serine/threonine-protein kinase [Sporobolomyces salmoneus]|uniref:serine/threonine-protein kinase n=1 Tax=Sporobolomyces salmoneus TaxID=183962 RepID=UPI003176D369
MSRGNLLPHEDPLQTPSLPNFKLAEKLGQGAFGSVYKALNWSTGETCAVKQIDLSHIARSELPDIMQEIDLLKNLHHSNIVQYRGYARTDSALYIILEYCENGSLSAIIKKFGRFPESLAGLYTLQVLQGLLYLHDQGVIHRDIKGSNILATKEGNIKLADFGVATRVGGPSDSAVVGSPYWMAPEVVDQTGATTASDIWSLGALVIELLTGKPPYHFLDPMPALFRIVNDDCPPIPQGASAVVRDFLVQCFQKDGNLRIGARKLLRHPWMTVAKKQQEAQSRDRSRDEVEGQRTEHESVRNNPISSYDDTVQQVQQWNEALKATPTTKPPRSPRPLAASLSDENSPVILQRSPEFLSNRSLESSTAPPRLRPSLVAGRRGAGLGLPLTLIQPKDRLRKKVPLRKADATIDLDDEEEEVVGEKESDNWDSDFEGGLSITKIEALDRETLVSDEAPQDDDSDEDSNSTNSLTIRATPRKASILPTAQKGLETVVEDYSDLVPEGQSDPFDTKVDSFKVSNSEWSHPGHDLDLEIAMEQKTQAEQALLRPDPSSNALEAASSGPRPQSPTSPMRLTRSSSSLSTFFENDVEDYSDLFAKGTGEENQGKLESLQLQHHLSSKSWLGDEDSDDEDPFSSVNETSTTAYELDEHNLEANLLRDQVARQCALVEDLLDTVESGKLDDYEVREAALQITGLLEDSQDARTHFKKRHGTLVIVEALQIARSREILAIFLRIVNLIVESDAAELEKLALVGGCPVVMSFASKRYSREIRLETALFIGKLCRTSLLTLQMFVSCRGLRTLVDMLDDTYDEGRDFVWMAVDGIARVFEMNGPAPRNDFCRLLAQEGLLEPLSSALISVCGDDDDLAESAKVKIVQILLLFAQSDHKVKQAMATRAISLRLIKAASLLENDLLAVLLKTIKNLSMLPSALDVLQNANTIENLIEISSRPIQGRIAAEIQNHTLHILFNLCRLSKTRQEEAASFGAIPILQKIVLDNSPLKQFALPILCDFGHLDSRVTRKLLWQHDGLKFYLYLLSKDPYWINAALEAIFSWFQDETVRVERCLLESDAVDALVRLFCTTKGTVFEMMLEPYQKILRTSSPLTSRLATQSGFCKRIVDRIERSTKAVVRLNLLRITKTVFDSLSDRRDRERVVKLLQPAISRVATEEKTVLASQLAKSLEAEFVSTKETTRRTLLPRRGASEGSTPGRFLAGTSPSLAAFPSSPQRSTPSLHSRIPSESVSPRRNDPARRR